MATIALKRGNCWIIKLEAGDHYIGPYGYECRFSPKQYLLVTGFVVVDIAQEDRWNDCIRVSIPHGTKPEHEPTEILSDKPDPDEWAHLIRKSGGTTAGATTIDMVKDAIDYGKTEKVREVVEQSKISAINEPLFSLKDVLLFGVSVAAAMFGIMR